MSDFSSKCREYLKNTGETVYQLSASSGLDRTSLQRMITGKRLPGMDFVRQFCDSIRINPSQRQELIELYKIEKIGKEIYYNPGTSPCDQHPADAFLLWFSQAYFSSVLQWRLFT